MFAKLIRAIGLLQALLAVSAPSASAANQADIDKAIKAGADYLKAKYTPAGGKAIAGNDHGVGGTCLVGLALLEGGVPVEDPSIKAITQLVRDESYKQCSTYPVALCLMYLDRLGDPADLIRIQMLGVRLLVGQTATGGWSYPCSPPDKPEEEKWLRGLTGAPAGRTLHPDIAKYAQAPNAARVNVGSDDNSNTQFAVIATWMGRKHGVPADGALALVEKRFASTQDLRTGNWPYSGGGQEVGSPSMYCAGLLGMATAVARREEKRKGEGVKPPPKPKAEPNKPYDPFYDPPAPAAAVKKEDPKPTDVRDATVQRAFAGLGATIAEQMRSKGLLIADGMGGHGRGDLYFLWSLERVCVIYGVDKIGGIDWHDVGSTALVRSQGNDGSWTIGGYGNEANTAFAVLFLSRSNLARDLSGKVQRDPANTEMRAGAVPLGTEVMPTRPAATAAVLDLPNPTGDASITLASKLLKASNTDWTKLLTATRDAKGTTNTRAMVLVANYTDGDRKKAAREALAERLCRMTPATLRTMLQATEAELRRAAALACAMKDDKDHVPDLVAAMSDADETVVRAAKAGLQSLTGKNLSTAAEWRDWLAKEKK